MVKIFSSDLLSNHERKTVINLEDYQKVDPDKRRTNI